MRCTAVTKEGRVRADETSSHMAPESHHVRVGLVSVLFPRPRLPSRCPSQFQATWESWECVRRSEQTWECALHSEQTLEWLQTTAEAPRRELPRGAGGALKGGGCSESEAVSHSSSSSYSPSSSSSSSSRLVCDTLEEVDTLPRVMVEFAEF